MSKEKQEAQEFDHLKENQYFPPINVEIMLVSPQIGLGVFATQDIAKDSIIERCPMVGLSWRSKYHGDSQIHRYLYTSGRCNCNECKIHGIRMFMVLGYGMIYNHQDDPNGRWNFNFKNRFADVVAHRPIEKGQQIFVSYGNSYFNNREKIAME